MKKILLVLGIIIIGLIMVFVISNQGQKNSKELQNQSNEQTDIQWNSDLNASIKQAKKENKLVLIDFYADWCHNCKDLDTKTLNNVDVKEKLHNYILVKINGDKSPEILSKYNITGYPTLLLLDKDGNIIKTQIGFIDPVEFLQWLK